MKRSDASQKRVSPDVGIKSLKRVIKLLFTNYKSLLFLIAVTLIISAVAGSVAGVFLNKIYTQFDYVNMHLISNNEAMNEVVRVVFAMLGV